MVLHWSLQSRLAVNFLFDPSLSCWSKTHHRLVFSILGTQTYLVQDYYYRVQQNWSGLIWQHSLFEAFHWRLGLKHQLTTTTIFTDVMRSVHLLQSQNQECEILHVNLVSENQLYCAVTKLRLLDNNNNNNNEILIKRKPLVYTRAWRTVQKTKTHTHTQTYKVFRLGQVVFFLNLNNSSHKLIQGQCTQQTQSTTHTHTHTHTPHQVNWSNLQKKVEGRDLASRGRTWTNESSGLF